jgi:hypothetical protein
MRGVLRIGSSPGHVVQKIRRETRMTAATDRQSKEKRDLEVIRSPMIQRFDQARRFTENTSAQQRERRAQRLAPLPRVTFRRRTR